MKKILLILTICTSLATGCGITDKFNETCGGDMDNLCQAFFGVEGEPSKPPGLPESLAEDADIDDLRDALNQLIAYAESLGANQEIMQTSIENLQADLSEAQLGSHVVGIIDPCGDDPNHLDEVLFEMASGQLVAYFRASGNEQFLTVLANDNYVTTDYQRCAFSVVNGEYQE